VNAIASDADEEAVAASGGRDVLSEADTRDIVAFIGSLTGKLPEQLVNAPTLPPAAP
jgi:hypothetical protein